MLTTGMGRTGFYHEMFRMDEASSRFVDQLALDKLVNEKLARVRHRPPSNLEELLDVPFSGFRQSPPIRVVCEGCDRNVTIIQSAVDCVYSENRRFRLVVYSAKKPKGIILLIHGLFEDNRSIYKFMIDELVRLGYSVYLTTLPFHYERRPQVSQFSGEFFFSADLGRTKRAFRQSTLEVQQCHAWLERKHELPIYLLGYSMGGAVALAVAGLTNIFNGICLINPAAKLSEVVWTSPLCRTIKDDLLVAGLNETVVNQVLATFDPCLIDGGSLHREKILMMYGLFDQVTSPRQYEALAVSLALPNVVKYKAGHLNVLRVPRLADDVATFFEQATAMGTRNRCETSP